MKGRGSLVSWLLLSLYVVAIALPAYVSMSCHCTAADEVRSEAQGCRCNRCLEAQNYDADLVLTEHCGCNHHSTDIALYTAPSTDDDKADVRCIELQLLPTMAVECPAPALTEISDARLFNRLLPPTEYCAPAAGLRAPPALV